MNAADRNGILLTIARRILRLETLEARRSDRLDFHDLAVWQVREALEAAFDAGYRAAGGSFPEPNDEEG